jgi:2-(1,2-epoxy-1,2-dihydrophenyl)acetyl-CoA isomerase
MVYREIAGRQEAGMLHFFSSADQGPPRSSRPPAPSESDQGPPRSSRPPAPSEGDIRIESKREIRDIVLDRRDKKNALTLEMYATLLAALRSAADDERTSVVVFRSSGGAFCIGDYIEMNQGGSQAQGEEVEAFSRARADFLQALADFGKPIVASVNGLAAGVGAMMLLCCDLVVASEFSAFEFSAVKRGIVPDPASCARLESRIGLQRASEWLLLGERIKADEALRLGLVNAVVPLENLYGSTVARAQLLASLPQRAARETKRILRERSTLRPNGR